MWHALLAVRSSDLRVFSLGVGVRGQALGARVVALRHSGCALLQARVQILRHDVHGGGGRRGRRAAACCEDIGSVARGTFHETYCN